MSLVIFIFGAIIGSFLNVCIHRLPQGGSLIQPPSHCPSCEKPVRFYDNIPLVSYLLLKGRCRSCQEKISPVYPLVELITGLIAVIIWWRFGFSWPFAVYFTFVAVLIVITFIDWRWQIIPDALTLPGIPLFFLAGVFLLSGSFMDHALGILAGGGILYVIAKGYEYVTGREGMGGGDVKLLAMIGGLLGWQSLIFVIFMSSFLGALVGIAIILARGGDMKYAIPFGPFLSLAAAAYIFIGQDFYLLLTWWLYHM